MSSTTSLVLLTKTLTAAVDSGGHDGGIGLDPTIHRVQGGNDRLDLDPSGQMVRYPSGPGGTTVTFSE